MFTPNSLFTLKGVEKLNQNKNQETCKWYLNGLGVCFDFAPGHRLIRPGPRVAAIGLLSCVHVHGKISPTPLKEDKPVYKSRAEKEVRKITQFVICLLSQRATEHQTLNTDKMSFQQNSLSIREEECFLSTL